MPNKGYEQLKGDLIYLPHFVLNYNTFSAISFGYKMAGFSSLAPKTKNLVVAGGLSAFVFGVYFYTMRAVGGTDELQTAIDKFEQQKSKEESEATIPSKP
uniref:Cytochrome c oxidase assembly factor 3 mitochondrial coiled-coil domain-containing protein n=2 Tax=Populus trichocarpa TaxID=3694 RepID=A0A2K1WS23_POPTR